MEWVGRDIPPGNSGAGAEVQQTSKGYRRALRPAAERLLGRAGEDAPMPDDHAHALAARQAERRAQEEVAPGRRPQKAGRAGGGKGKDADTMALEKRGSDALGLAVTVNHRDPGGSVLISYRNLEQLDEVMRRLARGS